jgi:pyruvate dehydrogenase (quinone)
MAPTVADYLLERLRAWDTEHVFAYAGDGINGILAAWGRAENKPQFVQARHEEMAAFEAVGYAKFTGRFGVCMATSGPGAIHLLNGLYDAKLDHVPVVAIVGQTNRSAMGGSYQQEVDLLSLFKDVASEYVQMVTVPEQLPNVLDRAIRTALAERAPTAIIIPADVQELEYSAPTHAFKMVPSSLGVEWPVTVPSDSAIVKAAEILNAGGKVAILAGQGARGARRELEEVAELLGAGVAKPLLGKDVLSDELPYVTGSIGLLGTRPSYELMMNCDTLLTVGSSFPYTQFLPAFDQARGVQIDIDGKYIGMRYPNELNQVTWEMRAMEGAPKFVESQQLPDVSYEAFARSLGLNGIAVDKPDQVGPAWDQALAADRPTVLDFRTDPSVPPIPPHATFEQAKDAATALLKGDPDGWSVLKEGLMTKAREIFPGKNS